MRCLHLKDCSTLALWKPQEWVLTFGCWGNLRLFLTAIKALPSVALFLNGLCLQGLSEEEEEDLWGKEEVWGGGLPSFPTAADWTQMDRFVLQNQSLPSPKGTDGFVNSPHHFHIMKSDAHSKLVCYHPLKGGSFLPTALVLERTWLCGANKTRLLRQQQLLMLHIRWCSLKWKFKCRHDIVRGVCVCVLLSVLWSEALPMWFANNMLPLFVNL